MTDIRLIAVSAFAAVLVGAVGHQVVQPHLPGSPQKRLESTEEKLADMTAAQRAAAARSWLWYGNYQRLHITAAQQHEQAAAALSAASRQCRTSTDRSYQAGVSFGRALERNRNANPASPPAAADDDGLQFDTLWNAAGTADRDPN